MVLKWFGGFKFEVFLERWERWGWFGQYLGVLDFGSKVVSGLRVEVRLEVGLISVVLVV